MAVSGVDKSSALGLVLIAQWAEPAVKPEQVGKTQEDAIQKGNTLQVRKVGLSDVDVARSSVTSCSKLVGIKAGVEAALAEAWLHWASSEMEWDAAQLLYLSILIFWYKDLFRLLFWCLQESSHVKKQMVFLNYMLC